MVADRFRCFLMCSDAFQWFQMLLNAIQCSQILQCLQMVCPFWTEVKRMRNAAYRAATADQQLGGSCASLSTS